MTLSMETLSTSLIGLALGFCGINHVNADAVLKPVLADRCEDTGDPLDFDYASIKASIAREFSGGRAPKVFYALGKDRHTLLKRLLADGVNPNVCHAGFSPLMMAVASGDVEEISILLDGGANPDKPRDSGGGTALMLALEFGRYDVAELLLDRGADAAATRDGGGTTLFSLASWPVVSQPPPDKRQLALAKRLISGGASIDAQQGANRSTALMIAALKGNIGLVSLLVERGADVSLKDARGQTAEVFAHRKGYSEIVELLNHAASTQGKAQ
jgi:ankyrin repeat protein